MDLLSLKELTKGGWDDGESLAVADGYVYLMQSGGLYGAPLNENGPTRSLGHPIDVNDWRGDLAVDAEYVYLMKDSNLYGARLTHSDDGSPINLGVPIATDSFEGRLSVRGGFVYVMKEGNLYGAPLTGKKIGSPLKKIDTGIDNDHWKGEFAVDE